MQRLGFGALNMAGFSRLGYGLSATALTPAVLQTLLNGFPLTITGGGQIVPDYLGVLRKVPSGTPAIEGGRWATTIAEGATLGPELWDGVPTSTGLGWTNNLDGSFNAVNATSGTLVGDTTPVVNIGDVFQVKITVEEKTLGDFKIYAGGVLSNNLAVGINTVSLTAVTADQNIYVRAAGTTTGKVSGFSWKKVIPQWLDTAPDGATPLQPFKMTRTKNGTVKEYIDIADRANSTVYALGAQVNGVATDGVRRYYTYTTAGTSGVSPPVFPTSGTVADGTAVLTYSGYCTMNFRRYLGEPARTNLLTYSEQFDNAAWSKTGTIVTANTATAPDGTLTADLVSGFAATGQIIRNLTSENPASKAYTATIWMRGSGTIKGNFSNGVDQNNDISLTLTADWKRHTHTFTFNATSGTLSWDLRSTAGYTATEVTAWGAQLELGAFATSYIPTVAATVTRPATVYSRSTTNVLRSQSWGARFRITPTATGQATVNLFGTRTDSSNYTELYMTATAIRFYKVVAGAFAGPTVSYTHTAGVPFEVDIVQTSAGMEIRYRALVAGVWGAWSAWVMDNSATAQLSAIIAATYEIGSNGAGANQVSAHVQEVAIIWGNAKIRLEALI